MPAAAKHSTYRDDPDAVSMHTTPDDYDYNDAPALPSYEDAVEASADGRQEPRIPTDRFATIAQPKPVSSHWKKGAVVSPGQSASAAIGSDTSIRMDESLMDENNLYEYIHNYLRVVAPRPLVRVQGWHWQNTRKDDKKSQESVTDFDVVFNLQQYLAPGCDADWWEPRVADNTTKAFRGSWRKARAPGFKQDIEIGENNATPDLMDFCRDFAESKAGLKAFRVSRSVTGLNTAALESQITTLVRSTEYLGHVDVTFPVSDRHVDIYSPHWANRLRISWVRWIFYLTFLWIFTWPVLFFMTRWWAIYEVEWRFSRLPGGAHTGDEQTRQYATISEQAWFNARARLLRTLVLNKYHGDATHMPDNHEAPDFSGRHPGSAPATGNRNVDAAIGLLREGVGAWNSINGRGGHSTGWGADERS